MFNLLFCNENTSDVHLFVSSVAVWQFGDTQTNKTGYVYFVGMQLPNAFFIILLLSFVKGMLT
jgi:hypothetical protein